MGGSRDPGPLCKVYDRPVIKDGTNCLCESPRPGPSGRELSMWDQFSQPVGRPDEPGGDERWFERRYPNLLESARRAFVQQINKWVLANWGASSFQEKSTRITVNPRDQRSEAGVDIRKDDNRFEACGDRPQDAHEADKVLGRFALDFATPVSITYAKDSKAPPGVEAFTWTTTMYAEDTLGLQEDNRIVAWAATPQGAIALSAASFLVGGPLLGAIVSSSPKAALLAAARSRRVKRAQWVIGAEVRTYRVRPGDSLSRVAAKVLGKTDDWQRIAELNRAVVPDPNRIQPGLRLVLPAAGDAATQPAFASGKAPAGAIGHR